MVANLEGDTTGYVFKASAAVAAPAVVASAVEAKNLVALTSLPGVDKHSASHGIGTGQAGSDFQTANPDYWHGHELTTAGLASSQVHDWFLS